MTAPTHHAHDLRMAANAPDTPILYRGWSILEDAATRLWQATKAGEKAIFSGTTHRMRELIDAQEKVTA